MNTDNINNFVDETFTKVKLASANPLKTKSGWLDQLKAIVNLIPTLGGAVAQEIQVFQDYKESEFFRKYTAFILGVVDTTETEREKFAEEIAKKANDAAGNVIAGMVDRLDNINKEVILANLTKARIDDKISIENFFRLASVLERVPYIDLAKLPSYQTPYYDEDGDTELLNSTGVLRPVLLSEDGDTYILSPLGVKLLQFGLKTNVKIANVKGTSVDLSWNNISEDSDVYMKKAFE
jgi:hypothetical protein